MGNLGCREKSETAGIFVSRADVRQRRSDYRSAEIEKQPSAAGDYEQIDRVLFNLVHRFPFQLA
jgi:hypothetical protein